MKLEVIIEKNADGLWGRIEGKGDFLPTTVAETKTGILANLIMLIKDYQQNEGGTDKAWNKIDTDTVDFEFAYDLQSFFEEYNFLKQTKIAELSAVNAGLLRQYASGVKHPSLAQAKKIETAIRKLAKELEAVSIYAE